MQSIFISGAAQGIGAAIARLFIQHGYKVGLYDINHAQVENLAVQLGENAKTGLLDVTDPAQWQTALQDFSAWAGQLNILVNNAGILYSGPFEHTDLAAHHRTIDINIKGVINGCYAALPYLKQADFARVINLSSASAIYGQADLATYSTSKFAVRGLTESLDIEWQKYGIRVLDVMPLFVQTAMVKDMNAQSIKKMGVNLQPEDVAQQILKLAQIKDHPWIPTHTLVGIKAKFLFNVSKLSPQFVNRLSNLFIAHKPQ
ncbi:MAG: SDR family oxidoreductase [Acinetobacter sp.]|uniref:SDR family oxidoreductase n=1 Tax=Acinetobacter sp. TaxID=472 RepID=UPI003CFD3A36